MKKLFPYSFLAIAAVALIFSSCQKNTEAGLDSPSIEANPNNTTGIPGSLAKFSVAGPNANYLYVVKPRQITVYDVSNAARIQEINSFSTNHEYETIFNLGDFLYMGTPVGMAIYSIEDPTNPIEVGYIEHTRACDPVVTDGQFAYVTLRGGNECGGTSNELLVLDVSEGGNPSLIRSYAMSGPYGLGLDDDLLFVCDGEAGLRVFDASNPTEGLSEVAHFDDVNAIDVIPHNGILMLRSEEGITQYKYEQGGSLEKISSMAIAMNE